MLISENIFAFCLKKLPTPYRSIGKWGFLNQSVTQGQRMEPAYVWCSPERGMWQ